MMNIFLLRLESIRLFDKSNGEYKEKYCVKNAWKEIDNSLGIEEGIILCYDYFNVYFIDHDNGYISVPKMYI